MADRQRCPECTRTYTVTGGDFDPNWTIHPGHTWREIIENSGQTATAVAAAIGVSRPYVSNILAGRCVAGVKTTIAFARHFDIEPRFLWQLQCNYELDLAMGKKDVTND